MNHQHPQIALRIFILPQTLERTARRGQVPPIGRKERCEQLPIFISRVMASRYGLHPRIIAAAAQMSQYNKLTLMGQRPGKNDPKNIEPRKAPVINLSYSAPASAGVADNVRSEPLPRFSRRFRAWN